MSIITEETKWDASDPESVWIFAESEVQVSDQVLGKGAFGEVRVAKWKNIDVAAKQLYEIEGESHLDAFMQEMRLLSRLRHPNLILFLGVCVNPKTHIPTTILTELMPGSLYNILEDNKVRLQLADILDIALDVATGLDYLHTQSPPIVHRDISAKNILVGGNRAKITDMGQAKVFELSLLSRHSSIPGSMAYCAPEVLTGKYDEKIDIFSFGVLIAHMSTGNYPRIDKREEQRLHAVNTYPVLAKLITECMSFQPAERPTAASICEQLYDIRKNDRHYPPARRLPPQSDVGVMARRWITEQVETRCKDVKLALEQTTRRLAAEEARWRDEADRADNHVKVIASRESTISEIKEALAQQVRNAEVAEIKLKELEIARDRSESLLKSANNQIAQLLEETEAQCSVLKVKDAELHSSKQQIVHCGKLIDDLSKQLRISKDNEAALSMKDQESLLTIEMQSEQSKELEARLEQAIMRWKKEKELSHSETMRCSKLRSANADLLSKNQRQAFEIEKLTERLDHYDTMSLQEELKARLQDLENDISQQKETIASLEKEKVALEDQKAIVEDNNYRLQETMEESIKSVHEATLKASICAITSVYYTTIHESATISTNYTFLAY
jgi:serine/threonine protein kinase